MREKTVAITGASSGFGRGVALRLAAEGVPFFEHAANYTGHCLQPNPITDADHVVDAIVATVAAPRDEITVGLPASAVMLAERLAPPLTQSLTGVAVHQQQMQDIPAAKVSHGNLHGPLEIGDRVHAPFARNSRPSNARGTDPPQGITGSDTPASLFLPSASVKPC